jgi:hypothetical protein
VAGSLPVSRQASGCWLRAAEGDHGRAGPADPGGAGRLGQLSARPAVPRLGQQRADIRERRQPRPGLREHRREQAAQLTVKSPQPGVIFYDGTGGHLLILSPHKA